jgi:hypothetical protein
LASSSNTSQSNQTCSCSRLTCSCTSHKCSYSTCTCSRRSCSASSTAPWPQQPHQQQLGCRLLAATAQGPHLCLQHSALPSTQPQGALQEPHRPQHEPCILSALRCGCTNEKVVTLCQLPVQSSPGPCSHGWGNNRDVSALSAADCCRGSCAVGPERILTPCWRSAGVYISRCSAIPLHCVRPACVCVCVQSRLLHGYSHVPRPKC